MIFDFSDKINQYGLKVIFTNAEESNILTKKDIGEKEVIKEARKVENIEKNLKDKKIVKNIFVKNKIINFITT